MRSRSAPCASGLWLGLAAALALMTKYWVLTMIGAVGLAALMHPDRMKFLRSPAPWVAIATLVVAMLPHLWWLRAVGFRAADLCRGCLWLADRAQTCSWCSAMSAHNIALLLLPIALAALALAWTPHWWTIAWCGNRRRWSTRTVVARAQSGRQYLSQARNIWIIQIIVAIGPPLGALVFSIYMKTDWGISLFFLVPLALVAIPALRVHADGAGSLSPDLARASRSPCWRSSPIIAAREMAARSERRHRLQRALGIRAAN